MDLKLFIQAITKLVLGVVLVGLLIFLPAGTLDYTSGWLLMLVLFVPMFTAGIVMLFKSPERLRRRLNTNEKQKEQRLVIKLSALVFIVGFIVAGFDFRFGWSGLSKIVVTIAVGVFLLAYLLYARVIYENEYLSRIIEVGENQKLIDTGLYSVIRHPMYSVSIFLFLAMPLILGSIWSFVIFLAYPFILVRRIKYEEEFLEKELEGYGEYRQKVKYRLIPFVW